MVLRVEQLHDILGPRLVQFWAGGRSRHRSVLCVTMLENPDDISTCQDGELVLLSPHAPIDDWTTVLNERGAHIGIAAVLVTPSAISERSQTRLRELASHGDVAVGVLAVGVDPGRTANDLSRALASGHSNPALGRLHTADTLQGIADSLGRLVGNSVTIETPAHDLLASSATGPDVDPSRVATILNRRADAPVMSQPEFEQFVTRVKASDWPLHIAARPEYGFTGRVAMRISANGELFGIIWVTDSARPLSESDYTTIKQAASVAAAIFDAQQLATRREATLRAELLDDVMKGRISDPEKIRTVARSVGWNIDRLQGALIVAIDDFESFRLRYAGRTGSRLRRAQERLLELVKLEVLALDPEALIGMRSSSVVILLDVGLEGWSERKAAAMHLANSVVRRSAAFLPDMHVTVGVGRDFPSLDHMADGFHQAELAAELGQTLWGGNRSLHYDDLGIHRVLFTLREHEGMMTPALQRMVEHDTEHGTDYVRTLATYLRHMGRLRPAAEELGVHRNTLEYRIGRITDLAGTDLEDPDHRLALELGIRLLELHGSTVRS